MYRALFFLAVTAFIFIAHPSVLSLNANNSSKTVKTPRTISDLNAEEKAAFIKHVIETGDCEWNGIKLYGKVEFVTSFPDIKIEYVTSFSDINVSSSHLSLMIVESGRKCHLFQILKFR